MRIKTELIQCYVSHSIHLLPVCQNWDNKCNGKGKCVDFNGEPACECEDGYSGDSCERRDGNLIFIVIVYLSGGPKIPCITIL